jgi:K+-transporting ATPase ATPase A chain
MAEALLFRCTGLRLLYLSAGTLAMTLPTILQFAVFVLFVTLLVRPVGIYFVRVFNRETTYLDPVLVPIEREIYRVARINPEQDMAWWEYTFCFVSFGIIGTILLFVILLLQQFFPGSNASYLTTPMTPDLAANVAMSFSTTTTWQPYAGETTMSYLSQALGLTSQNFLAGAAGLAVGIAFIRGFARGGSGGLGNFWADVVRATLWVLLPASLLGALFLVWQGVPINLSPYVVAKTVEGGAQVIPQGPVAALEFIENLGTNGGGFFNANGAHPYENPTPLANFVEMLAIAVPPAALTYTFGRMIRRPREGWLLYGVMVLLFAVGLLFEGWFEQRGNLLVVNAANVVTAGSDLQPGGNMEGKEIRFGIGSSALTEVVTSNGATGATNSLPDSYLPLGGLVPLVNLLLGEAIFGGLGTGLYSLIMVALLGLFLVGLMVGRTPEYVGKRIGVNEMRFIALYVLVGPLAVLGLTAIAVMTEAGRAGLTTNTGPHGFSEILVAFSSSFANNGQSFGGLSANTPFYNWTTALAMAAGRFVLAAFALGLAGLFAQQPQRGPTRGTLRTASFTFAGVLIGTLVIVTALSFFPALALGPIVEHFLMLAGRSVS